MPARFILSTVALVATLLAVATGATAQSDAPTNDDPKNAIPPIGTSRFAPPTSSFRELRMIGEASPPLPTGPTLVGTPPETLGGVRTILLFWSPFVPATSQHLTTLARSIDGRDDLQVLAIALGPEAQTRAFLEAMGDRAPKPATIVDADERSRETFLDPLGISILPAVVVVDENGSIMYHGNARESAMVLGQIVSGIWKPERYVADALEWGARQAVLREANRLQGLAKRGQATTDDVLAVLDEAAALDPANEVFQVRKFDVLLLDPDRVDEAYEHGRELMERFPRSSLTLNDLAWHVVSFPNVTERNLDFALEASRRSNALQGWMDPSHLDTLARVHWLRGEPEDAVHWQRQAVSHAADSWFGDDVRENLRVYTDGSLAPGEMPPRYVSPRRPAR